jgi:hypothetical protein
MVIDLAVHRQDGSVPEVSEGLGAMKDVDDRKTFVSEDRAVAREDTGPVRTPMALLAGELQGDVTETVRVRTDVQYGED